MMVYVHIQYVRNRNISLLIFIRILHPCMAAMAAWLMPLYLQQYRPFVSKE